VLLPRPRAVVAARHPSGWSISGDRLPTTATPGRVQTP